MNMNSVFIVLCLLLIQSFSFITCRKESVKLSENDIRIASNHIEQLIANTTDEDGVKVLIPGLIKLIFIDCIDQCDGCVNINQPGNERLKATIDALEPVYQEFSNLFSRADFWALAARQASISGIKQNNEVFCKTPAGRYKNCVVPALNLKYSYGRVSCETSPDKQSLDDLPNPLWGRDELGDWFWKNLRLGDHEWVMIMGTHTLGRAVTKFKGAWEPANIDGLGSRLFVYMHYRRRGWFQENIGTEEEPLYQWRNNDGHEKMYALNVDMATVYDLKIEDPKSGKAACNSMTCHYSACSREAHWLGVVRPHYFSLKYAFVLDLIMHNGYKFHEARSAYQEFEDVPSSLIRII